MTQMISSFKINRQGVISSKDGGVIFLNKEDNTLHQQKPPIQTESIYCNV